jgi:hypothetical protein
VKETVKQFKKIDIPAYTSAKHHQTFLDCEVHFPAKFYLTENEKLSSIIRVVK